MRRHPADVTATAMLAAGRAPAARGPRPINRSHCSSASRTAPFPRRPRSSRTAPIRMRPGSRVPTSTEESGTAAPGMAEKRWAASTRAWRRTGRLARPATVAKSGARHATASAAAPRATAARVGVRRGPSPKPEATAAKPTSPTPTEPHTALANSRVGGILPPDGRAIAIRPTPCTSARSASSGTASPPIARRATSAARSSTEVEAAPTRAVVGKRLLVRRITTEVRASTAAETKAKASATCACESPTTDRPLDSRGPGTQKSSLARAPAIAAATIGAANRPRVTVTASVRQERRRAKPSAVAPGECRTNAFGPGRNSWVATRKPWLPASKRAATACGLSRPTLNAACGRSRSTETAKAAAAAGTAISARSRALPCLSRIAQTSRIAPAGFSSLCQRPRQAAA